MDRNELKNRTKKFALDIIKMSLYLPSNPVAWVIGKQVIRSATSVGANYREACRGRSKAEFISKIAICESEADETVYWLELLKESNILDNESLDSLLKEASELTAIFTASNRSARRNL